MFRDLGPDPRSPDEERRDVDRARLIIDLFFEGTEATGVASPRDISAGGLYMNTLAVLPEGAPLVLRITLCGGQVVVNARVAYAMPGTGWACISRASPGRTVRRLNAPASKHGRRRSPRSDIGCLISLYGKPTIVMP